MKTSVLVITHIIYRKSEPYDALEGPYSSVCNALVKSGRTVETLQIPIDGYNKPLLYGSWNGETKKWKMPSVFGIIVPLKYFFDTMLIFFYTFFYLLKHKQTNKLIIAIDPLSCFSLVLLKKLLSFKLVFYSVDFNRNRFANKYLQFLYEKADEVSTRYTDQCWVVCQSLKDYKKERFNIDSIYIPNSSPFDPSFYENGMKYKTGNKLGWTGSFLTDKQFDIFFSLLKKIQELRPDSEFYVAPTGKHEQFKNYMQTYDIKSLTVLYLTSRKEWQEYASRLDVGIAIYDPDFGSTEFIEPLKIWDFMLCGMPFIISREPSLSDTIKKSGVAYVLGPKNTIHNQKTLKDFLEKNHVVQLQKKCIELAKEFDIGLQISIALKT